MRLVFASAQTCESDIRLFRPCFASITASGERDISQQAPPTLSRTVALHLDREFSLARSLHALACVTFRFEGIGQLTRASAAHSIRTCSWISITTVRAAKGSAGGLVFWVNSILSVHSNACRPRDPGRRAVAHRALALAKSWPLRNSIPVGACSIAGGPAIPRSRAGSLMADWLKASERRVDGALPGEFLAEFRLARDASCYAAAATFLGPH